MSKFSQAEINATPFINKSKLFDAATYFIKGSTSSEIARLFRNGTLWVKLCAISNGTLDENSFEILGERQDSVTLQDGQNRGLGLLADMYGLPEAAVLESEIEGMEKDEAEEFCIGLPVLPKQEAIQQLILALERDLELNIDMITERM